MGTVTGPNHLQLARHRGCPIAEAMKASQALEPSEDDAMIEVWAGAGRVDRLGEIEIRTLADLAETAGQGD